MRLIDADALVPKLIFIQEAEHQIYGNGSWGFASKCITAIEDAPTIEERQTGVWLDDEDNPENVKTDGYCAYCSACKAMSEYLTDYCGSCGADMRGTWNEHK